MAKNILTATVAPVKIGDIEIEGLQDRDGKYCIAVIQICSLFGILNKNASRTIKALLGKDFGFLKVKLTNRSVIIPNKSDAKDAGYKGFINAISLHDFRRLVLELNKKNNPTANLLVEALFGLSLEQLFADAFDVELTKEDRQRIVSRIMKKHCPWERLYEKEMCDKIKKWYGFDSSKFYWWYVYNFLTQQERAELEMHNPVLRVISKSGKERTARKRKIHQHFTQETRERLTKFAEYLGLCIKFSSSRVEFEKKWALEYGLPTQLEIFDLWEFAS